MELIEYRVRPVTRYIVTRFERDVVGSHCAYQGEFDSDKTAYAVAYALCKADHERKGWPIGDERIQYPLPIEASSVDAALVNRETSTKELASSDS